jgi:hypothetical protein
MGGILQVDTIQNNNTSNLITQTNVTTITIGASGQNISIPAGATLTNNGTASGFGLTWQSVQTTGFTAVKGNAYPCNTTSAGFTVTLPATPSVGDQVQVVDYAGTFDINALIISPNGNKIESVTGNQQLSGDREGVILTYIDSTQGWLATSGINEGTDALLQVFSADYLVVAGGGGGGGGAFTSLGSPAGNGGGGAGGLRCTVTATGGGGSLESALSLIVNTNYTVTVGAGGAGALDSTSTKGSNGSNSVFSTITSTGGGGGGSRTSGFGQGANGGSGGGGAFDGANNTGGTGTANQGYAGGARVTSNTNGGGGGASAVGGNNTLTTGGAGGSGVTTSITGSSVSYAGGGGGGASPGSSGGTGSNGGGNGVVGVISSVIQTGGAGTVNTGGGGGGGGNGGAGGSGIVIIKYPDTLTITNPGGGLTSSTSTSGGFKVTSFTAGTGTIQFN